MVARQSDALDAVRSQLGVSIVDADARDETAAQHIVRICRPDILAVNAGAKPPMGRLDQIRWEDFTATWA